VGLWTQRCIAVAVPNVAVQESVIVENTPDALAGEQTWPTEEELMEASNDEKTRLSKKKKKLLVPRGTSDYQVLNPPYPIACFSFLPLCISFVFCD
jgi:hypothetical protein